MHMLYQLMNKDVVVAVYEEVTDFDDCRYTLVEQLDSYLPIRLPFPLHLCGLRGRCPHEGLAEWESCHAHLLH